MNLCFHHFRFHASKVVAAAGLLCGAVAAPAKADTITVLSGLAKVSEHVFLDWANSCKGSPAQSRCTTKSSFITNSGAVVPPAGGLAIDFSGVSANVDLGSLRFEPVGSQTVIACPLSRVGTIAVNIGGTGTSTCGNFGTDTVTIYRAVEVKAAPKPLPAPDIRIGLSGRNKEFRPGHAWKTSSGYRLIFQKDRNLVLYSPNGRPLWATGCNGLGADLMAVQGDGNVVLYARGRAIWASNTSASGGSFAIQNDGNLVVYNRSGRPRWASDTSGGRQGDRSAARTWGGC